MGQPDINIIIVSFSLVYLLLVGIIISIVLRAHKRKVEFLLDKQRAQLEFEAIIARTRTEIQEQDFKNISWELHDNIGQLLSVAKMQLTLITQPQNSEDSRILSETADLISEVLGQIRMLSRSLNHEYIAFNGLLRSVQMEVDRLNRLHFLNAVLNINGDIAAIDPDREILLFRMVQEVLSNVIKHARATALHIAIDFGIDQIVIRIEDNGVGFHQHTNGVDIGISNLISRAGLLGATIDFTEAQPQGTRVHIICPLTPEKLKH
jgi:signal transduction histidine kinase